MEQPGSMADRRTLRVAVPQALFQEAALWMRPVHTPTRLHLQELGSPDLRCAAGSDVLRIEDISASGLRLTLARPEALGSGLALLKPDAGLPYLYLKLTQPISAMEERPLALLLCVAPVAVRQQEDGRLMVAMNILYRGQPDRDDKSLTFFYVAKHAIRELAVWCDEVALMERVPQRPAARGLRLDRLLLELDTLLAQGVSSASSK